MVEKLLDGIGESDIAICGFHHHYQGRDVIRIPEVPGQSGEENFLALYGQGFLNMPWNKLYKRELAGRFDESLSLGEDLLFNLDYLRKTDGIAHREGCRSAIICRTRPGRACPHRNGRTGWPLAKYIWRETSDFYRELAGHEDESGVINARLIQDVLDDVEGLPFDEERTKKEKLEVIDRYCRDAELHSAGADAALKTLDYQVIHFCMRRGWKRLTYELCELRAMLVRAKRASVEEETGSGT